MKQNKQEQIIGNNRVFLLPPGVKRVYGYSEDETTRIKAIEINPNDLISQTRQEAIEVTGDTSDGYHTFNELYEFRKLYNSALFNEWANGWSHGFAVKYDVHKSKLHHDGEKCFGGGWFIVMAETPEGQISNHYELKDWDLFNIPEKEKANEWDGHTAQDVIVTLKSLSQEKK